MSGLWLIEDREDGQRYYLGGWQEAGRCLARPQLPQVLRFAEDDADLRLMPASLHPGSREVLVEHCGDDGCPGLESPEVASDDRAFAAMDLATMLARWPADETRPGTDTRRQQYLDAVMALDRPTLRALKARGVYPAWTREAIRAVSDSGLALEQKRRRMAWLFHDHPLLAAALDRDTVDSLRDWLPLEDWGPVLKVIATNPLSWNQPLVPLDSDPPGRLSRLDCALQHAQQQLCGGGWRVD